MGGMGAGAAAARRRRRAAAAAVARLCGDVPLGGACEFIPPSRLVLPGVGGDASGALRPRPRGGEAAGAAVLGEGANAVVLRATLLPGGGAGGDERRPGGEGQQLGGEGVCLRVVLAGGALDLGCASGDGRDCSFGATARAEVAHASGSPRFVGLRGLTWVWAAGGGGAEAPSGVHVAQVLELCAHGSLLAMHERGGLRASARRAALRQALLGLRDLRDAGIVWRDCKAENLLVAAVTRDDASGEVAGLTVKLADWGTAVRLADTGGDQGLSSRRRGKGDASSSKPARRRMTLHGPGTAGYVAPDTRQSNYGFEVDMWAWMAMAADLCLDPAAMRAAGVALLEQQLSALRLSHSTARPAALEAKVKAVLAALRPFVLGGMEKLYGWLAGDRCAWVNPIARCTAEEALGIMDELEESMLKPTEEAGKAGADSPVPLERAAVSPSRGAGGSRRCAAPRPAKAAQRTQTQAEQRRAARAEGLLFSPPRHAPRQRRQPRRAAEEANVRIAKLSQ